MIQPAGSARVSLRYSLAVIILILMVVSALSLFIGRYPSSGFVSPFGLREDTLARNVVVNLRMPRLLVAILLGMSLGASGQVFQMLFANPLVEPGFLGVSQGAAFGAGFSVLFLGNAAWLVQGMAAFFAIAVYIPSLSRERKQPNVQVDA